MRILGRQFVSGHTIEEALGRAKQARAAASFDMLGEAAHTANDAERYFAAYETAITTLGRSTSGAEHTGFGVRVYPSGRKSYIVNYRAGDGGRKAPNKRVMLGRCDPHPSGGWSRHIWDNYGPSIAECAMDAKRTDRAVKCSFAAHKP